MVLRYSCRAEGHDQEQIVVFIREIQSSQRLVRIFYTSRLLKTAITAYFFFFFFGFFGLGVGFGFGVGTGLATTAAASAACSWFVLLK